MQKIDYSSYKKPSDFLKFEQGSNTIRILSGGGMMNKHSMKTSRGFVPLGECEGENCPHCLKGNVPKKQWIWIAINRTTGRVGVLETGIMIGNAICELAQEEGDPEGYDLIISKKGEGLRTEYVVAKGGSDPLTELEKKTIKLEKNYLIQKRFANNGYGKPKA